MCDTFLPVALTATIYTFDIQLTDVERGVYEALDLRVARHPSESEEYLLTRVLAYCLEFADGIAFSNGLSDPDEPAVAVRDLTGAIRVWIEIGAPDAGRLHKAAKAATRVVVYTHKDPAQLLRQWSGERIHRAHELEIYNFPRPFIAELVACLSRRMAFTLTVTGAELYITVGDAVIEGKVGKSELPVSS
jgi:uncharacterized protein YaeQ